MSPAALRENPAPVWAALLLGAWAAAIAFLPVLAVPAAAVLLLWWTVGSSTRWLSLFLGTALLLPPLPIPIGDSGPHPSLIFAAVGVFAGALWAAQWRFQLTSVNLALIALFAVLLASVASAAVYSGEMAAAGSLVRVLLFGISVYVFFYASQGPGRFIGAHRA